MYRLLHVNWIVLVPERQLPRFHTKPQHRCALNPGHQQSHAPDTRHTGDSFFALARRKVAQCEGVLHVSSQPIGHIGAVIPEQQYYPHPVLLHEARAVLV